MSLDYRASINHRVSKSRFLVKSIKHFLFLSLKILHIHWIEMYPSTYHTINMCNYFKYTSMCLWVYCCIIHREGWMILRMNPSWTFSICIILVQEHHLAIYLRHNKYNIFPPSNKNSCLQPCSVHFIIYCN